MKKILLASHGNLAIGLKHSVEFFLGKNESIVAIGAYVDNTDHHLKEIKSFIDSVEQDNAIIFTDIYGGSVNQQVTFEVLSSGKDIPIIANMNLPVVMSVALYEGKITLENINNILVDCEPKYVSTKVKKQKVEEENVDDFFR